MDVLSDVLRAIRLRGAVFFTAEIAGRWSVQSPDPAALARLLRIREECVALFHLVVEGGCTIALPCCEPVAAHAGSIVILPRADRHRLGNDLSLEPVQLESIFSTRTGAGIARLRHGRGRTRTRLICGYLRCDQRFNPLVGTLPPLLVQHPAAGRLDAPSAHGRLPSLRQCATTSAEDEWLARTVRHAVNEAEASEPGSAVVLSRLAELMFIEVLRRYMTLMPAGETGWLAAVRDPRIGYALRLLHEHPARDWKVPELAHDVGLSRSALGERFLSLVGEPPMRYLARWRMHLAEQLLGEDDLSVAQIASRVGFESSVAFHRAFKRHVGRTPVQWRSAHRGAA